MGKRIFSWFATLIVVISFVGVMPGMTASAAGAVQSKVNYVVSKWNGAELSSCQYNTSYGGCASQCYGFVKHATEYIFGKNYVYCRDNQNNAYTYVGTQPASNDVSYLLKTCKPGDVLNCGNAHTALVVFNDGSKLKVIQRLYSGSGIAYDGVWIKEGSTQSSLYLTSNKQARSYDVWRSKNYTTVDNGGSTALSPASSDSPAFGTPYTTSVSSNSAYIKCTIARNGSTWSQAGAYFGTSTSNMVKVGSDNLSNGYTWVGYDLTNLSCSTTYYYKFYIIANGKTYWSSISSFKTSGHNYSSTVVKPTYTEQGYTIHKCSVCGRSYKDNYTAKLTLGTVYNFKAALSSSSAVKLTWNKVSAAQGYIIYKYDNSKKTWVRAAKTASNVNTYTVSKLSSGTTYKFAIKAYRIVNNKEVVSAGYPQLTTATKPSAVNFTLTAGANKATVKWSKVTGASGYIVYYKASANGTWQRLNVTTGTSYTKTGLTKGKTYYFTVKAYKKVGNTTYNGAFTAKSVKVK